MAIAPYIAIERAMNTSTSTGTGNMVLGAEVDGYVTLDQSPLADDANYPFPYCIEGIDGACLGEVEIGIGTIVSGELVRDDEQHIVAGAFTAGAQTFSAGTKRIYLRTQPPASASGTNLISVLGVVSEIELFHGVLATANTTDATPTIMDGSIFGGNTETELITGSTFDISTLSGKIGTLLRLSVLADDNTDVKAWTFDILAKNTGTAAIVGSPTASAVAASAGAASWAIAATASGDNVVLTVTGEAAKNIGWRVTGRFLCP